MSEYVFKLPDLGEGMVESEIGEWFINVGEQVNEEDLIGTMMTDKAAVELSSPVSGKVVKLGGKPGDMVAVGAALVVFETDGVDSDAGASSKPPAKSEPVVAAPAPQPEDTSVNKRVISSPAVRRRARDAGVDLSVVLGTGPGGRILRQDFDNYVAAAPTPQPAATAGASPAPRPATGTKEIKVIGLRRIIAERMSASKREIPHFSYVEEIDITELEALRKHLNSKQENSANRLTILPFLSTALIKALREFPQCNATYDKERNVIIQHEAVHLGVATQTPDGLKVPVVQHAEAR
ncbi:MAG: dihydrolipoamide acetyltransferase family protein, partial [Proteobacteria bacterium]|nr:dihydrolipoamide acetyltransferase family protein [Pseudomonadota bacterium]